MKKNVVRRLTFVLLILMVSGMFAGCAEKKSESLRICVDLDVTEGLMAYDSAAYDADDFQDYLKMKAGLKNVVFEFIPASGQERETELSRLRTEIMTGGGPDVFIVHCVGSASYLELGEALFAMPEKVMELGVFLPLDEYIENAQFSEWDKFTQIIMDAGRNEEGQQLVPLTYSVHTAMYRAEDFSYVPSKMTWEDMLNSEALYDTAARLGDAETMMRVSDSTMESILGALADYKEDKLLFTEEELYQRVSEVCALSEYTLETSPYYTPGWSEGSIGWKFHRSANVGGNRLLEIMNGLTEEDTLTLVPLYSDDGGCTATVQTFAAVNRNTLRPQDAFTVIDCLLSLENQKIDALFQKHIFRGMYDASMPIHDEMMSSKCPTDQYTDLSDVNFAAVSTVREQITNVEFASTLDLALEEMVQACVQANRNGEDYSEIVHDAYTAMKQMISE